MAVDPYSLCPCGSGKKLKFCCSDLVHEIEKIHTMIEGDQPRAALRHVEQALAKRPKRASLLDLKAMLELSLEEFAEAEATIATLIEAEPHNPSAYALRAMLLAERTGGREAAVALQDALALIENDMPRRVLEGIGAVGHRLLSEGNIIAAKAHLWLHQGIAGEKDSRALEMLVKINRSGALPLALRDQLYMMDLPDDHPGEGEHITAQIYASRGRWREAREALEALIEQHADTPALIYNHGLVSGWLGDQTTFVDDMHHFARLASRPDSGIDDENAVEAETIAQLLDDPRGDFDLDVVRLTYPVKDEESLIETLQSDTSFEEFSAKEAPDDPPPRKAWMLLDKPMPETGVGMSREDVPEFVGLVEFYGRQTDKDERLVVTLPRDEKFDAARARVASTGGDALDEPDEPEVAETIDRISHELAWRWEFPRDTPMEHRRRLLAEERRRMILERWPHVKRSGLGGKTPAEVGESGDSKVALEAAVRQLEHSQADQSHSDEFAKLRDHLGLPQRGAIHAADVDVERLPLDRIPRLEVSEVSDDELVDLYRRATLAAAPELLSGVCAEALKRPHLDDRISWSENYTVLIANEPEPHKALELVQEARRRADDQGVSNAAWDIEEVDILLSLGDLERADKVGRHIRDEHLQEPGIAEQLYELLMSAGGGFANQLLDSEPQAVAAANEVDTGSPIWTPESESGGSGQKLWTPGG